MIRPSWDIFKAKFNENPQNSFEWLCYLLFCREFNKPRGIFRCQNQSAIETNPIKHGKDIIGWQAKFYGSSLSSKKKELISSIEKSKRDYPRITKLLFYTNQDWAQSKGKKSQGLIDIEKAAKDIKVRLDWRCSSFFESEFVSIQNEDIAQHFFTLDKSIITLEKQQQEHTEHILNLIQASILFDNQDLEIGRNKQLKELRDTSRQISILSGTGGVGKTALIKKLYEQVKNKVPFFCIQSN